MVHIDVMRSSIFPQAHTSVPIAVVARPKHRVSSYIHDSPLITHGVVRKTLYLGPNLFCHLVAVVEPVGLKAVLRLVLTEVR